MAAAYSASKAAVIALTKAVGKDFARSGVAVNCIAPAVIETPILGGPLAAARRLHGRADPDGPDGQGRRGRGADLLARERGVLVLDRRDVRHLRRPGDVLMRAAIRFPHRDGAVTTASSRRRRTAWVESGRGPRSVSTRRWRSTARSCCGRSTRPRCGARASPTSAAATRASRSRAATSTRSSTTPTGPSSSSRTPQCRRTVGPGEPDRDPLGRDLERARARDRRRPRRRPRDRGLHDRQRRLLARHRGREPALPPAGEGLRRRVRDRAGGVRAGGLGRAARDRDDDPRRSRARSSSRARPRPRG